LVNLRVRLKGEEEAEAPGDASVRFVSLDLTLPPVFRRGLAVLVLRPLPGPDGFSMLAIFPQR